MSDTEMLDWLERRRLALNSHYGTNYGWEFVSSHNVNRLFVEGTCTIDLNDAAVGGRNIREAITSAAKK